MVKWFRCLAGPAFLRTVSHLKTAFFVSAGLLAAAAITHGLVGQTNATLHHATESVLIFFGFATIAKVLTAWLYSHSGLLYGLPGIALTVYIYGTENDAHLFLLGMIGLTLPVLAFKLLAFLGHYTTVAQRQSWRVLSPVTIASSAILMICAWVMAPNAEFGLSVLFELTAVALFDACLLIGVLLIAVALTRAYEQWR
ncbi:hypothetical protein HKCCA1058_05440 [Rhodobacterales bacterium HKCCA1058]|nr:hypothetical protein [Rhodobacterales bacterium HKCCA1058]